MRGRATPNLSVFQCNFSSHYHKNRPLRWFYLSACRQLTGGVDHVPFTQGEVLNYINSCYCNNVMMEAFCFLPSWCFPPFHVPFVSCLSLSVFLSVCVCYLAWPLVSLSPAKSLRHLLPIIQSTCSVFKTSSTFQALQNHSVSLVETRCYGHICAFWTWFFYVLQDSSIPFLPPHMGRTQLGQEAVNTTTMHNALNDALWVQVIIIVINHC